MTPAPDVWMNKVLVFFAMSEVLIASRLGRWLLDAALITMSAFATFSSMTSRLFKSPMTVSRFPLIACLSKSALA
ncbi:hypothetical protein OGAPHI_004674 [Ogataea philodendri]|uniref:Uncharacterized protein n=1 Tax=Ogataea philodendri TaxID=1378263 RepID=A0A9P8P296_9ASCO|nr:uncharacterized protein OGAPHI_004674 [Ogataea philodendri]KAH3663960.1 hypothetical protein OGAPHI_004674 [Ogataea philodendri]